jgi:hypothetical protein
MNNIVSVSWGDHLVFGEEDGRLDSPSALERRISLWREDLGARVIHWRLPASLIPGRYQRARGYSNQMESLTIVDWDFLSLVPRICHSAGLLVYLYMSIFDEGWPLAPNSVRNVSYHNAMHGQEIAWQSEFSRRYPDFNVVDRGGRHRQWGVLSMSYPEVRRHFIQRFEGFLEGGDWDGLFICTRSQSKPPEYADQYGFNQPVRDEYLERYGRDIKTQDFDLQAWRDLRGEYLTRFLIELRGEVSPQDVSLAMGVARGDVLGPPLGNITLDWRCWVKDGLIDELVINQNSSRCPSMWHDLWPMHRGYGYVQNYLDGYGLPDLSQQLDQDYAPIFLSQTNTRLYIARQWDDRYLDNEEMLVCHPAVDGLVLSSFRYDNPTAIAMGDWNL